MDFSHPAFLPYQGLIGQLDPHKKIDSLNTLADQLRISHDNGRPLHFEVDDTPHSAETYEKSIFSTGRIPTRNNNLHDFLNALVWLRFPRLKSAINIRHCQMFENEAERKQRGKLRDQLTLMDESGVLVASSSRNLLELLRDKRWVELFWENRENVRGKMTFVVVGHGLLEKCLQPFASITGKCLLMETTAQALDAFDQLAASRILEAPLPALPPLPILGIPDWDDNGAMQYYQNTHIFRTHQIQSKPAATN